MPYVFVEGCDLSKMMQQVNIKAEVKFRGDVYKEHRDKCDRMLDELKLDFEKLLSKYYDEYNNTFGEILTNHEYNLKMSFH